MPATVVFNGPLAANATTPPQVYTVTSPGSTVAVELAATFSKVVDVGLVLEYATSIDGGVTYGNYTPVMELMPLVPQNSDIRILLSNTKDVDHVAFIIQNRNAAVAVSNVKLSAAG
jgi:hypothetical protein